MDKQTLYISYKAAERAAFRHLVKWKVEAQTRIDRRVIKHPDGTRDMGYSVMINPYDGSTPYAL